MATSANYPDRLLTGFIHGKGEPTGLAFPHLFPTMPVQLQSDSFDVFDDGADTLRALDILMGPRSKTPRIDASWGTDSYTCKVYGAASSYTPSEVRNASSALNVREAKALAARRILSLNMERVLSAAFQSAMSAKTYTPAGSGSDYVWSDYTTGRSNPVSKMVEQIGVVTDALWAGRDELMITVGLDEEVVRYVTQHPETKALMTGGATPSDPARIPMSQRAAKLAELFECDRVVILNSKYNSAAPGDSTPVMTRVWNHGGFIVAEPRGPVGMDTPCFGKLFSWDGYTELGMKGEGGMIVDSWKEPDPEQTVIRYRRAVDAKITNTSAARYLSGLIA